MSATFPRRLAASQPQPDSAQVDFVLVLTQNGRQCRAMRRDLREEPPLYIPITTGVIGQDGKLTLVGDANSHAELKRISASRARRSQGKLMGTVAPLAWTTWAEARTQRCRSPLVAAS